MVFALGVPDAILKKKMKESVEVMCIKLLLCDYSRLFRILHVLLPHTKEGFCSVEYFRSKSFCVQLSLTDISANRGALSHSAEWCWRRVY